MIPAQREPVYETVRPDLDRFDGGPLRFANAIRGIRDIARSRARLASLGSGNGDPRRRYGERRAHQ